MHDIQHGRMLGYLRARQASTPLARNQPPYSDSLRANALLAFVSMVKGSTKHRTFFVGDMDVLRKGWGNGLNWGT